MSRKLHSNQSGIAMLLIIAAVVLIAAIGGVGYYVMNQTKKSDTKSADPVNLAQPKTALDNSDFKCTYSDKDICKVLTNFRSNKSYSMTMDMSRPDGSTSKSKINVDGDNKHITTQLNGTAVEYIILQNGDIYTKSTTGTWYRTPANTENSPSNNIKDSVITPSELFAGDKALSTTTFAKIGQESCGNLKCLKYKLNDSTVPEDIFIWFDTQEHQMRKVDYSQYKEDGFVLTFEYKNIKVVAPSPSKNLLPNQTLEPGTAEPTSR